MRGKKQKEPAGMNCSEIFTALEMIEKERNIPQSFMLDKIVQALTTAYKRDCKDQVDNVIVDVDVEHRTLQMFVQKNVVDEEDYVDPFNEVPLEEAKKISAKYEIGDVINVPVNNTDFGRIAAGNGKQVIIQGLREAERGMVYEEFNSKQHEILTGVVTRIDTRNGNVSLRIGTGTESTEALLMAGEQVPGEELVEGMHVKVYVVEVRRSTRGPQVLISRTHPGLVKRLFELEVPEIYDGTVEVKSIAREAGSRTKMAVWSNDENVDPIGACVGPKGQRVENIVAELRGEKIDIVKFSEDPAAFIAAALAPADVVDVWMADEGKACRVLVPDDQLSLAIGKEGQNARLAARLTGYKIDIKPESYHEEAAEASAPAVEESAAADETPAPDAE
ncbi:transcription termination factor NusA [Oscillibacter ruminantium]|uniref:transcription termination factor NusA n=1 Tax=Oscillibacter ruminantium TaxID=1263547 RepID=UPI0002FBCB46|nr:transcription termination factor NusA [Oscillibacter ruminantium]MDN0031310.1 transcription termination factor NusA [Oscillibacter valericigenes]MEA5042597.1 transcription termination factor NusA [Oscillibacter ruminantium]